MITQFSQYLKLISVHRWSVPAKRWAGGFLIGHTFHWSRVLQNQLDRLVAVKNNLRHWTLESLARVTEVFNISSCCEECLWRRTIRWNVHDHPVGIFKVCCWQAEVNNNSSHVDMRRQRDMLLASTRILFSNLMARNVSSKSTSNNRVNSHSVVFVHLYWMTEVNPLYHSAAPPGGNRSRWEIVYLEVKTFPFPVFFCFSFHLLILSQLSPLYKWKLS